MADRAAEERPLTARELARLLRAFAHLIERRADADDEPRPRRRSPRRPGVVPSELAQARAQAALRRLGLVP